MDNKGYLREIAELNDRLKASYEREEESARRFAALEAERDGLRSFATAHENWEAALLNDDEAWRERSLPALTQTLWDAALALQYMRNEALGKSHTTEASHDDE